MLRFASATLLGLSLLSCDKPDSSQPSGLKKEAAADPIPNHKTKHRLPEVDASEELQTLLETASKIKAPVDRERALADVAWNAIEIDPDIAHEAFRRLSTDSPERIRLIQHYAMRLAGQDPEQAIEWASALDSELEISSAMSHIALGIAETDPSRAANMLSEHGTAGRDFDVALVQVIQRWAMKSAPEAADWVAQFPASPAREAGVTLIAEQWLSRDPAEAFRWLDSIKDTELRKEAARSMEGVILQQNQKVRDEWLQHANSQIRTELEQQRIHAIKDIGDNIPESGE